MNNKKYKYSTLVFLMIMASLKTHADLNRSNTDINALNDREEPSIVTQEIEKLQEELDTNQNVLLEQMDLLEKQTVEIGDLTEIKISLEHRVVVLSQALTQQKSYYDTVAEQSRESNKKKIDEYVKQIEDLNNQIAEKTLAVERGVNGVAEAEHQLKSSEAEILHLKKTIEIGINFYKNTHIELNSIQTNLRQKSLELNDQKKEVEVLENACLELEIVRENLELQLKKSNNTIEKLETDFEEMKEKGLAMLEEKDIQIKDAQEQLQTEAEHSAELQNQIHQARECLKNAEALNNIFKDKVNENTEDLKKLQETLNQMRIEKEEVNKECNVLLQEIEILKARNKNQTEMLNKNSVKMQRQNQKLLTDKKNLEELQKKLQEDAARIRAEIEQLKLENKRLAEENTNQKQKFYIEKKNVAGHIQDITTSSQSRRAELQRRIDQNKHKATEIKNKAKNSFTPESDSCAMIDVRISALTSQLSALTSELEKLKVQQTRCATK